MKKIPSRIRNKIEREKARKRAIRESRDGEHSAKHYLIASINPSKDILEDVESLKKFFDKKARELADSGNKSGVNNAPKFIRKILNSRVKAKNKQALIQDEELNRFIKNANWFYF